MSAQPLQERLERTEPAFSSGVDRLEKAEPAFGAGLATAVLGFVSLLGADFSTLHSAAVSLGMCGSQALLTRPFVFSPRSIEELKSDLGLQGRIPEVLTTGSGFAHPHEPAVTIGVLSLLGGFLIQLFGGVDLMTAFVSSTGIASVQTAVTRARVSSPVTARRVAAMTLLESLPDEGS